ncbi:50S ribosomal protein L19 [Candidatus Gottesmanbacteria bacterium]|nr:50S ribosomal protein L19 [Candidatus Gottesmanbacteria bacterium]
MANQFIFNQTNFNVGDTIRVHYKLIEKEKVAGKAKREVKEEVRERTQVFEGIVIAARGEGENKTFTVRRIGVSGIGIERIFPLISPWIKKITVKQKGKVRRAKLYYLRQKMGKEAEKLKSHDTQK